MNPLLEDLIEVLTGEVALYEGILALLAEEGQALMSRRPQSVLDVARRKETLVLKIRTLEESRYLICQRLAKAWDRPAATLTLSEIAARSEPVLGARLVEIRGRMRACVDKLRGANDRNSDLCRHGMETVRSIMEAVAGELNRPGRQAYGPKGGGASRSPEPASTMHWTT